ncbi:U4/U6-U5 snRNP complex subunit lsm6 [Sorochytrium milnesiophthora]
MAEQGRKNPTEFLSSLTGNKVVVKLNSGVEYHGIACLTERLLACLDGYMNIALEQTEEYVNGVRKNSYGDAFVRGNNDPTDE